MDFPLNAKFNPICKSQLTELFCSVFKFCACFLKNLNISSIKQDKFVKHKALYGERNRHCSICLKNSVISLLRNGKDKILKTKTFKYPRSFTYIVVETSTVCMEDGRKDVLLVVLCVVIRKTISVLKKHHITLDTCEHHCSHDASH